MKARTSSRCLLFIITIFVFVFQGYGQEKVEQYISNGLSTTIFNTSLGKVTVYLPEHNANENISGTLNIEPFGNSDKKKNKNKLEIEQYKLSLGNQSVLLRPGVFKISAPASSFNILRLFNAKGKRIAESDIQSFSSNLGSNNTTYIPEYMVSGEPVKIMTNCDVDLTNNNITINDKNVPVLAESESGVFFKAPIYSTGKSRLQFNNAGEIEEIIVNVLDLDLSVGRTNLMRGETTILSINLSGLEGLDSDVPLKVTNNSISNITLDGGNEQEYIINPSTDAQSGSYSKSVSIRALQGGSFSISVAVVPPNINDNISNSEELLCNCYINGRSYLISLSACEELGGHCSENVENDTIEIIEDETPPNFYFDLPEEDMIPATPLKLRINDLKNNDCVAVLFSYKSIDEEQWQYIGEDTNAENGLSFIWSSPSNNKGVYIIRARVVNKSNITSEEFRYVVFDIGTEVEENDLYSITQGDIDRAFGKARATDKRVKEEKEKLDGIDGMKDREWDAKERKKENEAAKNELIVIDKVLDSIPKTFKNELKRILDSLASLRKKLPNVIDNAVLQKAIDDAQLRVDDCTKRLEALQKKQADLEKQTDDLKSELDAVQESIYKLHIDNGWVGGYGYHPDGRPWHGYVGGERANTDLGDKKYELKKQYRALKKQYLKTIKRLGDLPAEIAQAEEDCKELNEALEKAKTAKENADLHAATKLKSDDICRQIKRLLVHLRRWCSKNPDYCDFSDKIKALAEKCPKDTNELEEFWKAFNEIVSRKKELEDDFGNAADAEQDAIDAIKEEIEEQKAKIKALEDQRDGEYEEARRKSRQRLAEAAEAKRKADVNKRERKKQKKEDEKIKDLIKK